MTFTAALPEKQTAIAALRSDGFPYSIVNAAERISLKEKVMTFVMTAGALG